MRLLSRSSENPASEDLLRVKIVFRYIAGTLYSRIVFQTNLNKGILKCYSDSDFAGYTSIGRSTYGIAIPYADKAIAWLDRIQLAVATSNTEAEINVATEAAKEVIWLTNLYI